MRLLLWVMAPARQFRCAGVVLFLALGACDRPETAAEGPRVLELANDTIELAEGVRLHDVKVARAQTGEFDPDTVQVSQGDMIRFTAGDRGGHALAFEGVTPEARAWLEQTAQLRSPPLLTVGSAWVITMQGAPPGAYRLRCTTHDAALTVIVQP